MSTPLKIIFVTHNSPDPDGGGGQHRTYQHVHDLQTMYSPDQIQVLSFRHWAEKQTPKNRWSTCYRVYRTKFRRLLENPYKITVKNLPFTTKNSAYSGFFQSYREVVSANRPDVCLIDHAGLSHIVDINHELNIPTVTVPQNFESLTNHVTNMEQSLQLRALMHDFASELRFFSRCKKRLFISKVEAAFVSGIGLPSDYYPYLPVGDVFANMQAVRAQRQPEPGLFLLLGSANHPPTRKVFLWFLKQVQAHGLPPGAKIIAAGKHTDKLASDFSSLPDVEFLGRISQTELTNLLVRAQATLVPYLMGFGALTRLSELTCAGVPVITSRLALFSMDPPPGVIVVDEPWEDWASAMKASETLSNFSAAYDEWYADQKKQVNMLFDRSLRQLS